MFPRFVALIVFVCSIALANPQIVLNDGSILKGDIINETDSLVVVKTTFGEQSIPRSAIKEIISDKQQMIHLKDGSVINGRVLSTSEGISEVETAYGIQNIPEDQISRIEYESKKEEHPNTGTFSSKPFEDIGTSMLYNAQKKRIGVALGLEMLGGGLLYAEKSTPGIIMLMAETGLIITPMFINDPDVATGLFVAALTLKTINTIWTVSAVKEYNNRLRRSLGLSHTLSYKKLTHQAPVNYVFISSVLSFSLPPAGLVGGSVGYHANNYGTFGVKILAQPVSTILGFEFSTISVFHRHKISNSYLIFEIGTFEKQKVEWVRTAGNDYEEWVNYSGPIISIGYSKDFSLSKSVFIEPKLILENRNDEEYDKWKARLIFETSFGFRFDAKAF
jgi:hypothetical protein